MADRHNRRGFLANAAAAVMTVAVARPAPAQLPSREEWLRGLEGKHRQFFDVGSMQSGAPLRRVHNFLATYASAYGLSEADINALFGAHGAGLPLVLGDAAWSAFGLGQLYGVIDPASGAPATRNIFARPGAAMGIPAEASIARLQARGVRFLACNNTISSLAQQLGAKRQDAADVRQALVASILPSVTVVPAMLVAGNRAQEEGLTYAALG